MSDFTNWVRTKLGDALRRVHRQADDESGQGMVEYGMILMLIALVVIVILTVAGHQVSNMFSNVSNGLAT
ncbi:MAG TPA: Flp family type IVb pilin [Candidatus Binatia bacterium]|nr:Flp family type IVb pilin [Candidatus Binatia bacterium]